MPGSESEFKGRAFQCSKLASSYVTSIRTGTSIMNCAQQSRLAHLAHVPDPGVPKDAAIHAQPSSASLCLAHSMGNRAYEAFGSGLASTGTNSGNCLAFGMHASWP